MNLQQRVVKQLEQLAAKGHQNIEAVIQESPESGYTVGIPSEGKGAGVSLSLADYDRYSATLRHLSVFDNHPVGDDSDTESYLSSVAAEIIKRLSYLEEPLALLELNTVDHVAQLRSQLPENGSNDSTYWEVCVSVSPHPQAKLARYHWIAGNRERTVVTYPATFATLGRIARDLAASLALVAEETG